MVFELRDTISVGYYLERDKRSLGGRALCRSETPTAFAPDRMQTVSTIALREAFCAGSGFFI